MHLIFFSKTTQVEKEHQTKKEKKNENTDQLSMPVFFFNEITIEAVICL